MPTYDYECSACGYRFDELQSFSEPPLTKCPKCKKNKLVRLFGGGGAVIFKGSGFYETDYRRAGQTNGDGKAEKADSGDSQSKGEVKPESAPATASANASTASASQTGNTGGTKKAK
jgi:putative FmdB family regulatory protein